MYEAEEGSLYADIHSHTVWIGKAQIQTILKGSDLLEVPTQSPHTGQNVPVFLTFCRGYINNICCVDIYIALKYILKFKTTTQCELGFKMSLNSSIIYAPWGELQNYK